MRKSLYLLVILIAMMVVSCGGEEVNVNKSGLGESCTKTDDCEDGLKCIDMKCTDYEKFENEHDGLQWSELSINHMQKFKAEEYCNDMGGRLPTISELRSLIQNCSPTENDGGCTIDDLCINIECYEELCQGCVENDSGLYSVFGDFGKKMLLVSSNCIPYEDTEYCWSVHFSSGAVVLEHNLYPYSVRCVKK